MRESDEDERARMRNEHVGFVFQNFQLIPTLTALENVTVPMELRGDRSARKLGVELLQRVGLADRVAHYPAQLSGGEQQRVALARAFINRPKILFADEPTGNLDAETSQAVIEIMLELNRKRRTALVLVTHDPDVAQLTERTIRLRNGMMHMSASFISKMAWRDSRSSRRRLLFFSTLDHARDRGAGLDRFFPAQPGPGDRRTGAHFDRRRSCYFVIASISPGRRSVSSFVRRTAGA